MTHRIKEGELTLPTLLVLENSPNGEISTSDLIDTLRALLKPTGEDLTILAGRTDDKFSQKVRNLVSHNTLGRERYAHHKNGIFKIMKKGKDYLTEKRDIVRYLITNDFNWDDLKESFHNIEINKKQVIELFDENIIINEGFKKSIGGTTYERSSSLRDIAIKYYKKDGLISCHCCNFNFEKFYGKELGKNFIEIHHLKPIFKYEDDDMNKVIKHAIKNVIPLCSNCHRITHRIWKKPLEIEVIMSHIKANGYFCDYRISI